MRKNKNLLLNEQGEFIPVEVIPKADLKRDVFVKKMTKKAKQLAKYNEKMKKEMFGLLFDFLTDAYETHGCKYGGNKGNLSLYSFSKREKVSVSYSDILHFNEQIQLARELFIQCLREWGKDGKHPEVIAIQEDALLKLDKQGRVDRQFLLKLLHITSKDMRWIKAQDILKNALTVVSSAPYLRVHERTGVSWNPIIFNFTRIRLDKDWS